MSQMPGYTYGAVAKSPVGSEDFSLLKEHLRFTDEDENYLRMAGVVLADQVEEILNVWLDVGSRPTVAYYFTGRDGNVDEMYLATVRKRFGQWILDTCNRPYNQEWLNYQHEIGLRHHRSKKNQTDKVESVPHIPLRYMIGSIYGITASIKPFLAKKGNSAEDVEKMFQAWFKSVVLQAALWSHPYANAGDW